MSCCGPKLKAGEYKFSADYRMKPIVNKFWSKHENSTKGMDFSRIEYYEKEIEKSRNYDARCHSKMTRYTNQTYGWLPGYKLRFLQTCDSNICQNSANQKVGKELLLQHFKGKKTLIDHCTCKELSRFRDHWKIV